MKNITIPLIWGVVVGTGAYFFGREAYKLVSPFAYVGKGLIDSTSADNFVDYFLRPASAIAVGGLITFILKRKQDLEERVKEKI